MLPVAHNMFNVLQMITDGSYFHSAYREKLFTSSWSTAYLSLYITCVYEYLCIEGQQHSFSQFTCQGVHASLYYWCADSYKLQVPVTITKDNWNKYLICGTWLSSFRCTCSIPPLLVKIETCDLWRCYFFVKCKVPQIFS